MRVSRSFAPSVEFMHFRITPSAAAAGMAGAVLPDPTAPGFTPAAPAIIDPTAPVAVPSSPAIQILTITPAAAAAATSSVC
jgi:hypothetical protein